MSTVPNDVVLDWMPPAQERRGPSQPYRLHAQVEKVEDWADVEIKSRSFKRRLWLDQHREGACTGFGLAHTLGIGYQFWPLTEVEARHFYYGARRFDRWAGEDYEGSSVHGAMDYAKKTNLIRGYWWCETLEELIKAVGRFGAVELGTNVYTGWFKPDTEGVITNSGVREGGHAYAVAGIDLRKHRARIDQSWGKDHGDGGSVYIDLDELGRLLEYENGEGALPLKRVFKPELLVPVHQGL